MIWILKLGQRMLRDVGSVEVLEDRVIAFLNMKQHYITPLKLLDNSKPEFFNMFMFYIVDLFNFKVVTTDQVLQQADFWRQMIETAPTRFSRQLPAKLVNPVLNEAESILFQDARKT